MLSNEMSKFLLSFLANCLCRSENSWNASSPFFKMRLPPSQSFLLLLLLLLLLLSCSVVTAQPPQLTLSCSMVVPQGGSILSAIFTICADPSIILGTICLAGGPVPFPFSYSYAIRMCSSLSFFSCFLADFRFDIQHCV